jgi:hypothetical protein
MMPLGSAKELCVGPSATGHKRGAAIPQLLVHLQRSSVSPRGGTLEFWLGAFQPAKKASRTEVRTSGAMSCV